MDLFHDFDPAKCRECGECFHQCPVMTLPLERAKEERRRLNRGEGSEYVLRHCTSCFACNFTCPENCNPAQQILDIWHAEYLERGMPLRARYYDPNTTPNFRTYVVERMPDDERAMVEKWKDRSPAREIFYPGCNFTTVPYLAKTGLLEGVEIRGSLDMCCGETYYRMGLYDEVRTVARRLEAYFNGMGVKRMIIPCTAGRNMFTNVLPRFGVTFNFEIEHMLPWLWRRIESGEIQIRRKLNMTVTIQESCYGKMFGEGYMDLPRKILQRIGVTVREEELARERTLCCGIAGGFSIRSGYHPWDITRATFRTLNMAKRSGADAIAVYCAGCLQMLTVGQIAHPFNNMPVYHVLELLQMAIGEEPARLNRKRGRTMFAGVMRHQLPVVLSGKRFRISVRENV
ncbi:MAG: (Fe-S)-binding protein [Spirochaetes bacterium]|nr:(Fe-S)-binding protein [Spirochaetota bacterium]